MGLTNRVLAYLAKDPYWLSKNREEVKSAKHSINKEAPLVEQLLQLPVEA